MQALEYRAVRALGTALRQRGHGFSLIELMIVLVVVAILAGIAYPSYSDYVKRGKIVEAFSSLSDMQSKMEQYYQDNRTYVGACAAGTVAPLPTGKYFTFACPTLSTVGYTITATGYASGMTLFAFVVDQSGNKQTTSLPPGWAGNGSACWVTKNDGSC